MEWSKESVYQVIDLYHEKLILWNQTQTESKTKMFIKYVGLVWTRLLSNFVDDILRNILSPKLVTKSTTNVSWSRRGLRHKF